jgi:SAM-dependent methyltransferase
MGTEKHYENSFYTSAPSDIVLQSPRAVVPLVISLVRPKSVVDVGCGTGAWLRVFQEQGIGRVLGIEGNDVDTSLLLISQELFREQDLTQPFRLGENFDLAVCLEVAEHLPKRCAEGLVASLVSLAPIILFSAAVPLQGGVHHVNEQWPEYWARIFLRHNYRQLDLLRKRIWKSPAVEYFYRQNMFLYVREDVLAGNPELQEAAQDPNDLMLVHPSILKAQLGLRSILKNLPRSLWEFTARRFRSLRS